ncbi:MAG: hypothetical protein ACXVCM_19940 [Ktedonobacteraceae bacterium]
MIEHQKKFSAGLPSSHHPKAVAGVALMVIGLLFFMDLFIGGNIFGLIALIAAGLIFIVLGVLVRYPGPIIPGGILSGLGVGVLLAQQVFPYVSDGGIITLSMGLGFLIISPLSMAVSGSRQLWALIPGGFFTVIGISLLIGKVGLDLLSLVGRWWPLAFIFLGGYFLWEVYQRHPEK